MQHASSHQQTPLRIGPHQIELSSLTVGGYQSSAVRRVCLLLATWKKRAFTSLSGLRTRVDGLLKRCCRSILGYEGPRRSCTTVDDSNAIFRQTRAEKLQAFMSETRRTHNHVLLRQWQHIRNTELLAGHIPHWAQLHNNYRLKPSLLPFL